MDHPVLPYLSPGERFLVFQDFDYYDIGPTTESTDGLPVLISYDTGQRRVAELCDDWLRKTALLGTLLVHPATRDELPET